MNTTAVYQVVIGCVPDSELGSNGRLHYMAKARKVKQLREFVGWTAREHAPPEPLTGPVTLRITVGWPKGRKRQDDDNLVSCLKAVQDGLCDAGWFVNDSQVSIQRPIEQQPWSRWQDQGGWLYPHGCMSIEVKEQGE